MPHLFSPAGRRALALTLQQRPLLALDFDGTLAPIVARPGDARVSQAMAACLRRIATRMPVAIVSGRQVADLRDRLGFTPRYIVGNHGAEDVEGEGAPPPPATPPAATALNALRRRLQAATEELRAAGVTVEDKQFSLALHYRLARDAAQARVAIDRLLAGAGPALRVFGGKRVVNVAAADAPDKADAVRSLARRSGAASVVFVGDDVNDEPVFAAAEPGWLTVRVGRDDPSSRARYFLGGPAEVALLMQHIVALLPRQGGDV